ncbi:alpha/beta hydrolase [Nocardia sp. NPDC056100]|uniref:alpha/beta hydrolase n=1 Tax=Nocardia sp. NPDC056100 TaxID=3345712 RepID=UPI0035D55DA2
MRQTLRYTMKPVLWLWALAPNLPWPYRLADQLGRFMWSPRGLDRRWIQLANARAEMVTPADPIGERVVLYFHGGAFYVGGKWLHRQLVGRIAKALSAPVLSVDYRMLPKHSVAAAIDDCVDAYRYLLGLGVAPESIVFMGDSAGGYLTFATAITARDEGLPVPAAIAAMSPLTGWDTSRMVAAPTAATCDVFPIRSVGVFTAHAERANGDRPLLSPVDSDLTGLPPTLIQTTSTEMTFPDAELLSARLAARGVPCEFQLWLKQVHVFQAAAMLVPESRLAIAELAAFVDRTVATVPRRATA